MTDNTKHKNNSDQEAILIALDQLSQTMEVMSQVVARLKRTVEQARFAGSIDDSLKPEKTSEDLDRYYRRRQRAAVKARPEKIKEPNVDTPIIIH